MRVQRPMYRRRSMLPLGLGCAATLVGCLLVAGLSLLLLWPALPRLAMQLAGFSSKGQTDALFTASPLPTVVLQNSSEPPQVFVSLGTYGSQALSGAGDGYSIAVGTGESGTPLALATFTEAGLLNLCRSLSDLCQDGSSQYRNVRIDLRPGGMVIYGDVSLPDILLTQTVGVVLQLDGSRTRFEVAGVDLGGMLYDVPPGSLREMVADFERVGNDILRQLTLQAGGASYLLAEVRIDDDTLMLVLR